MKAPLATALAILVGLLVLAGYVVPVPALLTIRTLVLGWALILVAVATIVGVINLVRVHWLKASRKEGRDVYSIIFLLAFLATVAAAVVLNPTSALFQQVIMSIEVPAESSLMAILAIVLAYASLRLLQRRRGLLAFLFVISAVIFLFLSSGLLSGPDTVWPLNQIIQLLNRLPDAGARGILLGIALGSLVAGLRILMGADRPYRG